MQLVLVKLHVQNREKSLKMLLRVVVNVADMGLVMQWWIELAGEKLHLVLMQWSIYLGWQQVEEDNNVSAMVSCHGSGGCLEDARNLH